MCQILITSCVPDIEAKKLADEIRMRLERPDPIPSHHAHLLEEWMRRVYVSQITRKRVAVADLV